MKKKKKSEFVFTWKKKKILREFEILLSSLLC